MRMSLANRGFFGQRDMRIVVADQENVLRVCPRVYLAIVDAKWKCLT
jgi:hypothetical protein